MIPRGGKRTEVRNEGPSKVRIQRDLRNREIRHADTRAERKGLRFRVCPRDIAVLIEIIAAGADQDMKVIEQRDLVLRVPADRVREAMAERCSIQHRCGAP